MEPKDLDPSLLMWDLRRRLRLDRLPARRTVVRFDFRNVPRGHAARRTWWLVSDRGEIDLCIKDPGFPVDLGVAADLEAFTKIWMGRLRLADAERGGLLGLEGPRSLVRGFPDWLDLSTFATVPRPGAPARGR
jgi:hypothetical protein